MGPLLDLRDGEQAAVELGPRLADRQPRDLLQIGMVVAGEGTLLQDGRECELRPGDFAIYETGRPFTWNLRPDWHLRVYTWPRQSIGLSAQRSQALTARTVCADSPVGKLLSPVLSGICTTDRAVSSGGAIRLAQEIADLGITAALEVEPPNEPAPAVACVFSRTFSAVYGTSPSRYRAAHAGW